MGLLTGPQAGVRERLPMPKPFSPTGASNAPQRECLVRQLEARRSGAKRWWMCGSAVSAEKEAVLVS